MTNEGIINQLTNEAGNSSSSVVVLMCGIAGSGKTTFAQTLERKGFVRLSIDEEIWKTHGRYGIDYPEEAYEGYKVDAERTLRHQLIRLIQDQRRVVVDFSFWQRSRREKYKELVRENGGSWKLVYLKVQPDELRKRLGIRSRRFDANAAFPITDDILTRYLNGFEEPSGEGEIVIEP